MRKMLTSLGFIAAFAVYGLYQYSGFSSSLSYVAPQSTSLGILSKPTAVSQSSSTKSTKPKVAISPVSSPPAPSTSTHPKTTGQYVDGTYTGNPANAYYGNVQVQVTVSGGKITDVKFLQYPNDRSTSRFINGQAMPILTVEAIQTQNAQVDAVSGASDTSAAFRQSLASALSQAKA